MLLLQLLLAPSVRHLQLPINPKSLYITLPHPPLIRIPFPLLFPLFSPSKFIISFLPACFRCSCRTIESTELHNDLHLHGKTATARPTKDVATSQLSTISITDRRQDYLGKFLTLVDIQIYHDGLNRLEGEKRTLERGKTHTQPPILTPIHVKKLTKDSNHLLLRRQYPSILSLLPYHPSF